MSGAGFILAINLSVAGLFAVAFFLVAANNRSDRVAVWFGGAYLFGVFYFVFEFLLPHQVSPKLTGYLAFASFLGAVATIAVGIAKRYRVDVPWRLIAATAGLSLIVNWFAFDMARDSVLRMVLYQAPYAAMQAIGAWVVFKSKRRQALDVALLGVFSVSAAQFLSKPFVAVLTDGPGASAQEYIGTNYALYSQTLGAVLAVGTGLLMLMILVRDMLHDVTRRSETDPLSGLFNRRGFEDRAEPGLAAANRGRVPATFVAGDLDHFKSVNDTWGHEIGDRVIEAFGALVKASAPSQATAARIGGEEFAIFLPGANLAAGRLFAESLRMAFGALTIPGVPEGTRFTASFGIAEADGTESLSDLRRRADAALYNAKRTGRDRVCSTPSTGLDAMPNHPLTGERPKRRALRSQAKQAS